MTIANTVASKLTVAFVAAAMMFSLVAPAQAQTAEELQAQIDSLMATITALQAQLGVAVTPAASADSYMFTRSLTIGATGADVTALQNYLIAAGFTIPAGATGYFGSQTQAAVAAWQGANGVAPAVGYFGPISQARYAELMAVAAVVDTDTDTDTDEDTDTDTDSVTLRGEASLNTMEIESADDDQVEEGAEDAPIAEVTVEFDNGDAEISRMDIALVADIASTEQDPWDVFESISLWVDGDKVAEMNADDEDDYLDEDEGSLRFSNLDLIGEEDEEVKITIAATLQSNLDSMPEDWTVSVETLRFFDADGVATTEILGLDFGDAVEFTIEEAGYEDEIIVKSSSNDPDATTLQVEDDSKSDWYNVFTFDLDTDDSINDIEINSIKVNVLTTLASFDVLVDDAELVIDGVTIDDYTAVLSTTTIPGDTAVLTFDVDGDVVIDAGDRVEAEFMLRFNSLANEGATVKASISPADTTIINAEGADDLGNSQLTGSATGDAHTLRTTGVNVSLDSKSSVVTTGDAAGDDYATYKLVLDVTAFEQDVFFNTNESTSVQASVVDSAGVVVAGTSTVIFDSSADVEGGSFKINEGETETVTVTVTFDAATAGAAARLQLTSLTFGATDLADNQTWMALPANDYRTDLETLVN